MSNSVKIVVNVPARPPQVLTSLDGPDGKIFDICFSGYEQTLGVRCGEEHLEKAYSSSTNHVFKALIEAHPGLIFGSLKPADRTIEVLFQMLVDFIASFECEKHIYSRMFGTVLFTMQRTDRASTHMTFTETADTEAAESVDNEPLPFGNGWITLPRAGENGKVGIFSYCRSAIEGCDYTCERTIHSIHGALEGDPNAYLIVQDITYNYMRVWADGRYEPITARQAVMGA